MKHQEMNFNQLLDVVGPDLSESCEKSEGLEAKGAVKLEDKELWSKFNEYTNEMIVTKNGRRMFPVFKVMFTGLDPNSMYTILLDFVQVDNHRWKYVNGEWVAGGKAEPSVPNCMYVHPDSPNFGSHWMKESVSFSKVKLTNKHNGGGQVMLNSLHKYEPRVHVVKITTNAQKKRVSSFNFPDAQFIAVTAYQNEEITALKIKHNPFAKAFLDAKERPEQRDYLEESFDCQQRSFPHLAGTWYLPSSGSLLPPPPAHQFPNTLNLSNPHCERFNFRNTRHTSYSHPYQRRSPTNFNRDIMTPNLPVLNIAENWGQFSTSSTLLSGNSSGTQSQYGMWMAPNISSNQSCSMPYLRNAGYSIPSSSSPAVVSSIPNMLTTQMAYDQCDISNFLPSPGRESIRNSTWNSLSQSPL